MHDVDPKILARLIKAEKKGHIMWQKENSSRAKFELISNGRWTVVAEEITDPGVRVALFSIFDEVIDDGKSIEFAYGEIKHDEADYRSELSYAPQHATSAATITSLMIGQSGTHPAAQFIYDNLNLLAVNPEHAALTWGRIAFYDEEQIYSPIYLGEEKEIMVIPLWPFGDKTWPQVIQKQTGVIVPKADPRAHAQLTEIDPDLFANVRKYVIDKQQCTVSSIQRYFRLSYTVAARLVDALEAAGVVGPFEGGTPREVLVKE